MLSILTFRYFDMFRLRDKFNSDFYPFFFTKLFIVHFCV